MIRQLEFMLALHRERHFGRASEVCGVSQPTLSNGLKALEDMLGVLLVQRASKFQDFTPEGERVVEWARRILGDVHGMKEDLAALKIGLRGHLRLAVIPTALPVVAKLTTPFHDRYPAVRFTVLSRTSAEILKLLDNREIDAGLTYLDNEPVGLVRTVPLYEERHHLLTGNTEVFGSRSSVNWAEVATLPLCLLTPDMQNRRIIDQMLRNTGMTATAMLESNSTSVLVSHVRTGQWSSVMPKVVADSLGLPENVASIPITQSEAHYSVGLVVAPREPSTPLVTALLATARHMARELKASQYDSFLLSHHPIALLHSERPACSVSRQIGRNRPFRIRSCTIERRFRPSAGDLHAACRTRRECLRRLSSVNVPQPPADGAR